MEFRILGPLEVRANGASLPLGGPKQRALLAILLLSANRAVSRDRLAEELWPEQAAAAADRSLRVSVGRLRKALGEDDAGESRLVTRAPGYLMRVDPDELDLDRFEGLVAAGRKALGADDAATAVALLHQAEALWHGRPLADLEFEPFARVDVERLEEIRLGTVEDRIDAELAHCQHAGLVSELETLVAEHPLRERLRGQLMLALYRSDRQAEALAAYREGRDLLVGQLGLDPSPRLQDLEQAILRQDAALMPTSPHTTAVLDRRASQATSHDAHTPAQPPAGPARHPSWAVAIGLTACLVAAAGAVVVLSGGGEQSHRLPVAHGLTLVSTRTGRPVTSITLNAAPTQLAAGFGSLWVTHLDAATVSRIDLANRTVRQTIRVGGGPSGITTAGGAVWAANSLDGTVSRIDPDTNSVVQTIPVGAQPGALAAVDGDVWVTNRGNGTITRLDASTGRVRAVVHTGRGSSGLVATGRTLWVSNEDDGTVSRVDARAGRVLQTIHVGDAPSAIAATGNSIWVLDRLDATVSRIDATRDAVTATVAVGNQPSSIALVDGAVWVSDQTTGRLSRLDAADGQLRRGRRVGQQAGAINITPAGMWVAVTAAGPRHRGGTLRVAQPMPDMGSIDPAVQDTVPPPQLLGMTNDGLVTLDHVAGSSGARLVADLALSLPTPTAGGRIYSFRLRPGVRFSTGQPVRASDVRHSLERVFELRSSGRSFYSDIVGARACQHRRSCDLRRGIVTDDGERTATFHLRRPDPDFLFKLAQPWAYVLPSRTPSRDSGAPLPATGPYVINRFAPRREVRLVRNPRFREWSKHAQPDGYPDQITVMLGLNANRATALIKRADADLMPNAGAPAERDRDVLRTRFSGQLRVNWSMGTDFFFLNTRVKPFDDVRVRRAVNYAFDRRRAMAIHGGPQMAQPTCQILPPQMPGFARYCPYTKHAHRDGRWRAPDLPRARRLVAASGTKGMTVKIWDTPTPQFALDEGRYLTGLLRGLGYRASLHVLADAAFLRYTDDSRNRAQVVSGGWGAEYPAPSNFIAKLSCAGFIPNSTATFDNSEFCDPAIDRLIARAQALQSTHPAQANALWGRIDREFTDHAIWVPTVTSKVTDIVSRRVGNYHYHAFWGVLVDQLWVR